MHIYFSVFFGFLSCLYGSERFQLCGRRVVCFLSCLYGSEHVNKPRLGLSVISKLPVRQ
ncbi:conserved hypothetical protein [Escherichia coli]|nr:conserved hypothetical protein [Escherichia coli]